MGPGVQRGQRVQQESRLLEMDVQDPEIVIDMAFMEMPFLRNIDVSLHRIGEGNTSGQVCWRIPWSEYRRHFDVCMRLNNWSDAEAGMYLATRLQGLALNMLHNLPLGLIFTYAELVFHLDVRFGSGDQLETFSLS